MNKSFRRVVASAVIVALVVVAFRSVYAEGKTEMGHEVSRITSFVGDTPFLIVFDPGSGDSQKTVMINPKISQIGDKLFVGGNLSDAYADYPVLATGSLSYIALERVIYIHSLNRPKPDAP